MKLLRIFDIQEYNVNDENALLKKINTAYKKLSLQYHPDRTGNNSKLTEKYTEIMAVYEVLKNPVQRKYYFANYSQLDRSGDISSIIRKIKLEAVDVDKQNRDAAIHVFSTLYIPYNQHGLDKIERAIHSSGSSSPFYRETQKLSQGAKAHFHKLLNECKEGIHKAIETTSLALEQQKIPCNQRGIDAINAQITQIAKQNYHVIPSALFQNAHEGLKDDLICAYEYCLTQYKEGIDFVCNAVKKQRFKYNLESLAQIEDVITRLSQDEYSSIPWLAMPTNMDQLKKKYIPSLYLDRLNQYKTDIESIYEKAKAVIKQPAFAKLKQMLRELSDSNYANIPPELFMDIPLSKKQTMIAAYHELLLMEHKKFIATKRDKIEVILNELASRINSAEQEIQTSATCLLTELQKAKTSYLTELERLDITPDTASQNFTHQCKLAIDKASPVLERDIGWGLYLTNLLNLLKVMVNGVIWVASFGNASNFFKEERRVLEQAEQDLKSCSFG